MKQVIIITHRYLGLLLSVVFVIWFLSGFVMMFYSFPRPNKIAYACLNLPVKSFDGLTFPDSALALTLETRLDQPLFRITDTNGEEKLLDCQTLIPVNGFSEEACRQMAQTRCPHRVTGIQKLTQFDMWIPWANYARYFPIYKYTMGDSLKTCLYVSAVTGEIVQETNHETRLAACFGAIPHWAYIKQLRLNALLWKNTVIALSALGSLMCISGLIVGIRYFLKARKRKNVLVIANPYKKFWMKWHYWLGLVFGIVTFTYVFSGMMSLCEIPQFIASGKGSRQTIITRATDTAVIPLAKYTRPVNAVLSQFPTANKVEWVVVGDNSFYKLTLCNGSVLMANADSAQSVEKPLFEPEEVIKIYQSEIGADQYSVVLQQHYDHYYRQGSRVIKPLPVYRIDICNQARTTLYVDPVTAQKIAVFTNNLRLHRWVYQFLHCFDTPWLLRHSQFRLVLELVLMIGGTLLSVTGLWLTIKKLTRHKRF